MATQKQVQILATYYHKTNGVKNGTVTYCVRSSNGKDFYYTTVINGEASGCSCPSRTKCYHMKQLENREQEKWIAYRQELAKKLAAQFLTTQIVEQVAEKLVAPEKPVKVAKVIKEAVEAKVPASKTDISTKGNLNTGRAFSTLR